MFYFRKSLRLLFSWHPFWDSLFCFITDELLLCTNVSEKKKGKEKIQSTINFKSKLLRNIFFKHLNVYSCRNKYDTLSEMINFTFDTESKTDSNFHDNQYSVTGYLIIRPRLLEWLDWSLFSARNANMWSIITQQHQLFAEKRKSTVISQILCKNYEKNIAFPLLHYF